ncbi:hypothetical protein BDF22DRAFT_778477 [Syncephalis plumigaleata]|nr:hypothetical protein BDF22DRAFT_778477 [Syncephalis plumigaleata]
MASMPASKLPPSSAAAGHPTHPTTDVPSTMSTSNNVQNNNMLPSHSSSLPHPSHRYSHSQDRMDGNIKMEPGMQANGAVPSSNNEVSSSSLSHQPTHEQQYQRQHQHQRNSSMNGVVPQSSIETTKRERESSVQPTAATTTATTGNTHHATTSMDQQQQLQQAHHHTAPSPQPSIPPSSSLQFLTE